MKKFTLLFCACIQLYCADSDQVVGQWLAKQTNIQTWAANFTQTRTLRAINRPLISTGQVRFAAPQNFRWELGQNQTIAIRSNDTMLVIYPKLKRAEKYDFTSLQNNQWKDTLALLQSGFPRSRTDLDNQFNLLNVITTNSFYRLELEPRSAGARKMMPRINLLISTNDYTLAGTELVFMDHSTMRNDFRNIRTNASVQEKFEWSIPPDFKLVEPLQNR